MPLIRNWEPNETTRISVWQIEEPLEAFLPAINLTDADRLFIKNGHPNRVLEWSSVRYLLQQMCDFTTPVSIEHDATGKPFVRDHPGLEISLSHSYGMSAVMTSLGPVGIDIQKIGTTVERIKHKFLSQNELSNLGPDYILKDLHIMWGAKEALYKLYAKGRLQFNEDIYVDYRPNVHEGTRFNGSVLKNHTKITAHLQYEFIDEHILVHAS